MRPANEPLPAGITILGVSIENLQNPRPRWYVTATGNPAPSFDSSGVCFTFTSFGYVLRDVPGSTLLIGHTFHVVYRAQPHTGKPAVPAPPAHVIRPRHENVPMPHSTIPNL